MISPSRTSRIFQPSNTRHLSRSPFCSTPCALRVQLAIGKARQQSPAQVSSFSYLPKVRTMATKSESAASHASLNRNSLFDMKGRVALVTGGGSGIGLMATQALAVNGAKVYITGRNKEKLEKVVETYSKDIEGEIIALPGDVTSKGDLSNISNIISAREECLCILVNNAGVSSASVSVESATPSEMKHNLFDAQQSTFEDWTSTYRTNVAAVYFTTAAFLPLLAKSSDLHHGWSGTVINISSISGLVKSAQHHFSYNASKAATIHLNRMLAAEIAGQGYKIRVNTIAPGVFPSEMTAGGSDEFQKSHIEKEKYADKIPAGRPGRDVDMAQAVLFCAAEQYLNGQVITVDGGYTLAAGL